MVRYRRFGTTHRSHIQGQKSPTPRNPWVHTNDQPSRVNIPEDWWAASPGPLLNVDWWICTDTSNDCSVFICGVRLSNRRLLGLFASPCEICGYNGEGCTPGTSAWPYSYHSANGPHSSLHSKFSEQHKLVKPVSQAQMLGANFWIYQSVNWYSYFRIWPECINDNRWMPTTKSNLLTTGKSSEKTNSWVFLYRTKVRQGKATNLCTCGPKLAETLAQF